MSTKNNFIRSTSLESLGGVCFRMRWSETPECNFHVVVRTPPRRDLTSIVLAGSSWLEDTLENTRQRSSNVIRNMCGGNGWSCDDNDKEHQNQEVQSTVLSHHSLSQLSLLQ